MSFSRFKKMHFLCCILCGSQMSFCRFFSVPTVTSVKGFDEDSVASLSATQDETQDTHVAENGISNNSSHPFQGGGYMLAASYWPKVINYVYVRFHNLLMM